MKKMFLRLALLCSLTLLGVFVESGLMTEGDSLLIHSLFINSGLTEMKEDDVIQWRFGKEKTLIATFDVKADRVTVYDDVLDGRFRDRLKVDRRTGFLTITDATIEHVGCYELQTKNTTKTVRSRFERSVSVKEGDSITLNSHLTEMKKDDEVIQWSFGDEESLIAEINATGNRVSVYDDVPDGRFRDRLILDHQTGDLTITNTRITDSDKYKLESDCMRVLYRLNVYEEMRSVFVMGGDSVTLDSGLTKLNDDDQIQWRFVTGNTIKAEINTAIGEHLAYHDGRFRDGLNLDDQTRSWTITKVTSEHDGLYYLLIHGEKWSSKAFRVSVYSSLPVPVIIRNSSQCSSSDQNCSVLCSVVNVSHVTLSWYKGNSLLSSISVSDLSISLSLPLEVEYQDTNTYSCVVSNPISHQTQHLNISGLCHACEDSVHCCGFTEAVIRLVLSALVGVATAIVVVYDIRSRRAQQDGAHIHSSET